MDDNVMSKFCVSCDCIYQGTLKDRTCSYACAKADQLMEGTFMSLNNKGVYSNFLEKDSGESHTGQLVSDGTKLTYKGIVLGQWEMDELYLNRTVYSKSVSSVQTHLLRQAERKVPIKNLNHLTNIPEEVRDLR